MLKRFIFVILFIGCVLHSNAQAGHQAMAFKARLIKIFPRYMEWPNKNELSVFKISVLSYSDSYSFSQTLTSNFQDRTVDGLPIEVIHVKSIGDLEESQIVYVDSLYSLFHIHDVISKIDDYPTLLITDDIKSHNFMINFVEEKRRVKIEMNENPLWQHNFKFNPDLKKIAIRVLNKKMDSKPKRKDKKHQNKKTLNRGTPVIAKKDTVIREDIPFENQEEIILDSASLLEKNELLDVEKKKIEEALLVMEESDDLDALMKAQQKIIDAEESMKALQKKFSEVNQLALANKKLLEQEKVNSKAEKDKNQILFWGISISVILLFATIYFLIQGKKLNRKVKKALNEVSEVNEELNQTNEELASQRDLIEKQKEIVEEAHHEIKESINYAKRIQSAILPADELIKENLPESFVIYQPKDVVAGDFYWLEAIASPSNKVLFAAADCTGHGVPGAMVSVVCHNAMNRAVREYKNTKPSLILDKTRELVLEELSKSNEDVKDGMDIALCSLEGNKLQYSGANNPLWIVRAGELLETKADKQPIGKFDDAKPFVNHEIDLQKGDSIYIFSDGYVDQFGGPKDKKFGSRRLKELLLTIQNKSMKEQKEVLESTLQSWMQESNAEQLDDVCVMGMKISYS